VRTFLWQQRHSLGPFSKTQAASQLPGTQNRSTQQAWGKAAVATSLSRGHNHTGKKGHTQPTHRSLGKLGSTTRHDMTRAHGTLPNKADRWPTTHSPSVSLPASLPARLSPDRPKSFEPGRPHTQRLLAATLGNEGMIPPSTANHNAWPCTWRLLQKHTCWWYAPSPGQSTQDSGGVCHHTKRAMPYSACADRHAAFHQHSTSSGRRSPNSHYRIQACQHKRPASCARRRQASTHHTHEHVYTQDRHESPPADLPLHKVPHPHQHIAITPTNTPTPCNAHIPTSPCTAASYTPLNHRAIGQQPAGRPAPGHPQATLHLSP